VAAVIRASFFENWEISSAFCLKYIESMLDSQKTVSRPHRERDHSSMNGE
jgi:hypothetical protein